MKRLLLVVLSLFVVSLITGCTSVGNTDLHNHLKTMDANQTYVIKTESVKSDITYVDSMSSYIYVDNFNSTFLISNEEKDVLEINNEDIMFEYEDSTLYGYVYNESWRRYEVDNKYLNIKYFETVLFSFFSDAEKETVNDYTVYKAALTMNDLEGRLFNIIGEELDSNYNNTEFEVTAYYSIVNQDLLISN